MALDLSLATAWKAAHSVGATPAPNYPGGDDAWVVDWFSAGVNAGDPRLIKFADPGATVAEGKGEKDLVTNWQDAADPSEWMGKRKPNARELRKWAITSGRSEDYARFPDRVLADWIKNYWDVGTGAFHNDFGDVVDKPTESGANSRAAGYPTGLMNAAQGGGGGGYGGGGGTAGAEGGAAGGTGVGRVPGQSSYALTSPGDKGLTPEQIRLADLQGALEDKFLSRQDMFGFAGGRRGYGLDDRSKLVAQSLKGGGLWWGAPGLRAVGGKPKPDVTLPPPVPALTPAAPEAPASTFRAPGGMTTPAIMSPTGSRVPATLNRPTPVTQPAAAPIAPLGPGGPLDQALLIKRRRQQMRQPWGVNPVTTPTTSGGTVDYGAGYGGGY